MSLLHLPHMFDNAIIHCGWRRLQEVLTNHFSCLPIIKTYPTRWAYKKVYILHINYKLFVLSSFILSFLICSKSLAIYWTLVIKWVLYLSNSIKKKEISIDLNESIGLAQTFLFYFFRKLRCWANIYSINCCALGNWFFPK